MGGGAVDVGRDRRCASRNAVKSGGSVASMCACLGLPVSACVPTCDRGSERSSPPRASVTGCEKQSEDLHLVVTRCEELRA